MAESGEVIDLQTFIYFFIMSDNIAGIVKAEFCFVADLIYCAAMKHGILLELKQGRLWREFPARIGNIEIDITELTDVVHDTWTIAGKIRCPRKAYENTLEMVLFRRNRKILVKYTTANGDVLVVGNMQYPIIVTHKILNGATASAYSGVEYQLAGAQFHPQLPLL